MQTTNPSTTATAPTLAADNAPIDPWTLEDNQLDRDQAIDRLSVLRARISENLKRADEKFAEAQTAWDALAVAMYKNSGLESVARDDAEAFSVITKELAQALAWISLPGDLRTILEQLRDRASLRCGVSRAARDAAKYRA